MDNSAAADSKNTTIIENKKVGKEEGSGGDDGCIGNRRVRTIILSILISVFFIMALPSINDGVENTTNNNIYKNAYSCMFGGGIICIVGAISAVLLFIIPNCDNKLGRVAGFILFVGGIIYLIGWIIYIYEYNNNNIVNIDDNDDELKRQFYANLTSWFGEALLPAGSVILLGVDAAFHMYENEAFRLSSNLGIICIVSLLCIGAYYSLICNDNQLCVIFDGVEAIATGYLILFCICLFYIILYILTCCTCNCKDTCLIRIIVAITLIIGGIITSIGYFVYVGADHADLIGNKQNVGVVYFVGYCILIAGLSIVWALDMAFDDVKNR